MLRFNTLGFRASAHLGSPGFLKKICRAGEQAPVE
jgi:hypothetical protein